MNLPGFSTRGGSAVLEGLLYAPTLRFKHALHPPGNFFIMPVVVRANVGVTFSKGPAALTSNSLAIGLFLVLSLEGGGGDG